jgi:hypothetical protein
MFGDRERPSTDLAKKLKPVLKEVGIQRPRLKIFPLARFIKS